jgi:hypothetical protein
MHVHPLMYQPPLREEGFVKIVERCFSLNFGNRGAFVEQADTARVNLAKVNLR